MKRAIDINELTDGNKYVATDMVKADCNGCAGCSACCKVMGNSVVLDPMDIYQLTSNLGLTFEELMKEYIELSVVDGLILPSLQMNKGEQNRCGFLNDKGRCDIHAFRPGICRLYPLGRLYEDNNHTYILQIKECKKEKKSKVKIKNWLGISDLKTYENYINQWHYFIKELGEELEESKDQEYQKKIGMIVLQLFYVKEYGENFYLEFQERLQKIQG